MREREGSVTLTNSSSNLNSAPRYEEWGILGHRVQFRVHFEIHNERLHLSQQWPLDRTPSPHTSAAPPTEHRGGTRSYTFYRFTKQMWTGRLYSQAPSKTPARVKSWSVVPRPGRIIPLQSEVRQSAGPSFPAPWSRLSQAG